MTTFELRRHLDSLRSERAVAEAAGLAGNDVYMHDLDDEYELCRHAYVGAAVTEIASFRGQLSGRPQG